MDRYKITAIGVGLVAIVTVIAAMSAIDNPFVEAEQKKDQKRLQDFSQIFYGIQNYVQENKGLPQNLDELKYVQQDQKIDAITGKEYEYQVVDTDTFKLCTEFATDSSDNNNNSREFSPNGDLKEHKKGYDCIEYTVLEPVLGTVNKPLPL